MKTTVTNGNSSNKIRGSRISIWTNQNRLVDRFEIPTKGALFYINKHPNGECAQRFNKAVKQAETLEQFGI